MIIILMGFQRSGTTILRRIFTVHPQVKRLMHEPFLLKKFKQKNQLINHIKSTGIDLKKDNWGEKVPFYPNIRKIYPPKYCEMWHEWFGKQVRVIHIIRHPVDIARSVMSKYKVKKPEMCFRYYNKIISRIIPEFEKMKYVKTIKYEDLLMNPDNVVREIYAFCNLDSKFDYKKGLSKFENTRYAKIDPSRGFAYKNAKIKFKYNIEPSLEIVNMIPGPIYES